MSTLERIAFYPNRRDEVPNQELARDLAAEDVLPAVNDGKRAAFRAVLTARRAELSLSQASRLRRVEKRLGD